MAIKDKATLTSDKNAAFADNSAGDIEAVDLRDQQGDIIDSLIALVSPTPQDVDSDINFNGDVNFNGNVSLPNLAQSYKPVLNAFSLAVTQEPAALNTPLQIEFGAAQFTIADPVMISAAGLITFNESGHYAIEVHVNAGRLGTSGAAKIVIGELTGGSYSDLIGTTILTSPDARIPFSDTKFLEIVAGTSMTYNVIRDGAGTNFGGLFDFNPALAGVPTSPTASIKIYRWQ